MVTDLKSTLNPKLASKFPRKSFTQFDQLLFCVDVFFFFSVLTVDFINYFSIYFNPLGPTDSSKYFFENFSVFSLISKSQMTLCYEI